MATDFDFPHVEELNGPALSEVDSALIRQRIVQADAAMGDIFVQALTTFKTNAGVAALGLSQQEFMAIYVPTLARLIKDS